MAITINSQRIKAVGEALGRLGLEGVMVIEEGDPQYRALEHLVKRVGDCSSAALLTVLNAISAYQLSAPGEDYWWEFATYPFKPGEPDSLVRDFISFLESSRGNVASRDKKISRVRRLLASQTHIEIYVKIDEISRNPEILRTLLSRSLGKTGYEKTIVFAVKMFYYVSRICGYRSTPPATIEIPVDRRVAAVTYTSGIADTSKPDPVEEIMRSYREAQRAWAGVSEISGIPMISLDSILWLCGKYVRDERRVEKAYAEIAGYARGRIESSVLLRAVSELLYRRI
ncbi:MAG TPA: N-glycosylase/DNA lyase [Sulfolobales archaeon]|nr:N-glycosylase/DNA lyase [Sulfolobales archaeon]